MSEEKKKSSFFQSLKNSILNNAANAKDKDLSKAMSVKSVSPISEETYDEEYKGSSLAPSFDIRFAENFVESGGKFIFSENITEAFQFIDSLKTENDWNHVFSSDINMQNLMTKLNFQKRRSRRQSLFK